MWAKMLLDGLVKNEQLNLENHSRAKTERLEALFIPHLSEQLLLEMKLPVSQNPCLRFGF